MIEIPYEYEYAAVLLLGHCPGGRLQSFAPLRLGLAASVSARVQQVRRCLSSPAGAVVWVGSRSCGAPKVWGSVGADLGRGWGPRARALQMVGPGGLALLEELLAAYQRVLYLVAQIAAVDQYTYEVANVQRQSS